MFLQHVLDTSSALFVLFHFKRFDVALVSQFMDAVNEAVRWASVPTLLTIFCVSPYSAATVTEQRQSFRVRYLATSSTFY